ncbi:MAG: tRNA lysidine(34) synthetase TilS [candidate division Zixibacteria bacterium]|nr:tRNA lysidine(34) synthetase TilS [candidate division Zixibacteria bacterium]
MLNKFKETLNRWKMLQKKDRVLVACSGGPDSIALLYLLNQIKGEYKLKLHVAHVNHKLRGRESDEEENFVRELARKLNLQYYTKSFDIKKIAKLKKLSVEECARKVRYDFFNKLACRIKASKIALGHTADDQAETVLMRLIRGAGSLGLCGMSPVSGRIIRPLLDFKKENIEKYLRENKLAFRIDSSNLRKDYLRNRIRLELLPYLRENYNPRIVETLTRTASVLSSQENFIRKETVKIFDNLSRVSKRKISLDLYRLFEYDMCLRRELVRLAIERTGGGFFRAGFEAVERILDLARKEKSGRRIFLKKTLLVEVSSKSLNFYQAEKNKKALTVRFPGVTESKSFGISFDSTIVRRGQSSEKSYSGDQMVAFLDREKLKPPFILRNARTGDRFKPLGMSGEKSLKDFLTDLKIPRYEKEKALVLTSGGRIAWVVGYRIGDEFKVTESTKTILKIKAF